jgi:hypothetical protein
MTPSQATVDYLREYAADKRRREQAQSFAADLEAERERRRNGDRPSSNLELATARELCALPDPPASEELLGPLLMRGNRLVLGGHTGEGKTTMALAIARAVALEGDFLGWRGAGGRVLVIDAEQGLKTIKRRLREAGLEGCEAIDYVRVPDGLGLDSNEDDVAAVEALLAAGDYALVLADPLYKLHAGDSNDERQAVALMKRFDGWRERYGFALLLPVHLRKPPVGAKFTIHEFFGSSAYQRGAEVVIGLQRVRDGYSRLHFFKDRDGDLPVPAAWGLLFDRESGFRRDPDDETPKQTAPEVIAELLRAQPEMTERQLVEASGYTDRTVRDTLKKLQASERRPGAQGEKLWSLDDEAA